MTIVTSSWEPLPARIGGMPLSMPRCTRYGTASRAAFSTITIAISSQISFLYGLSSSPSSFRESSFSRMLVAREISRSGSSSNRPRHFCSSGCCSS